MLYSHENDYNVDNEWTNFLEGGQMNDNIPCDTIININRAPQIINVPKGTDLYISTKTKIAYLSHRIDLARTFWQISVGQYNFPKEGVIKKQMKFNFINNESVLEVEEKLQKEINVDQFIITQIINPVGRIKFKDIRKISIGLANKDITSYRSKKKSAFYNCFVLILRIKIDDYFKEVHVKVFNTGKLEIPGIRYDDTLKNVLDLLVKILSPLINDGCNLTYNIKDCETVLINSNFNCGFFINRDKLLDILKYKYKIACIFDACQYPGIQCKYTYKSNEETTYTVSFMIFRTGSVLIVGKCDEDVLYIIYNYIKNLLITEYSEINVKSTEPVKEPIKKKKLKKRVIYVY